MEVSMERIEDLYAVCTYIPFYNEGGNYSIAKFKSLDDKALNFTVKGNFYVKVGDKYRVTGKNANDIKYPNTFIAQNIKPDINLSNESKEGVVTYLSTVTSSTIAQRLVDEIPNVISVIESGDIESLTQVTGVGEVVARRIMDLHSQQNDYGPAIIGLSKYGLTDTAIKNIVDYFKNPERAVEVVNDNPYALTAISGFGFKRCDAMFLMANQDNPLAVKDKRRVGAYVDFLFEEEERSGNTWLSPKEFVQNVMEFIPEADVRDAIDHVNDSGKYITLDVLGMKRITPIGGMKMELEVAQRLNKLNQSSNKVEFERVEETILHVETNQGFAFDEDQLGAIHEILRHNVYLLQGAGGVGKTATINGVSRVLRNNGLNIAQAALSGKAANNLSQATGFQGKTIHSLLKYGTDRMYKEGNPLPYDVVIIDEISMVNIEIFLSLLRAMKDGAKLIMLGDSGQLDSIGVGVMAGMMFSGAIKGTTLTKIHRQAQKSAIITHSKSFRSGDKPGELTVKSNTNRVYGENKDFEYIFTKNDDEDTIYRYVMIRFKESIDKYGVDNTQILCSTRKSGTSSVANLNFYSQIAANPASPSKKEIQIESPDGEYTLREGDKVINTRNNYNTRNVQGAKTPIFNGNTGTILSIDHNSMVIEFDGVGEIVVKLNNIKDAIQLGYAITTHKSQGSTIESVIIAMPFHFMLNSRELLYTATTRASKKVTLVTSPRTFQNTLRKTSKQTQQTNLDLYLVDTKGYQDKLLAKLKQGGNN